MAKNYDNYGYDDDGRNNTSLIRRILIVLMVVISIILIIYLVASCSRKPEGETTPDDSGKTTYYYLITDGTSVSKAYSSNKPFYHNGSQIFLSDGTQNNVITSSTSIASITGNKCNINADFCKAMSNAKQDGYFTKPVKNDYITLSNISIDFDNYYKCLMQQ